MQDLIARLKVVRQEISKPADELTGIAVDTELEAIIQQLEALDAEHARQTDELCGLREEHEEINNYIRIKRRETGFLAEETSGLSEDAQAFIAVLLIRLSTATDDAAAMRGVIEGIRDMARRSEKVDVDSDNYNHHLHITDLLGAVSHQAADGLKNKTGAALRKDLRQLEAMVDAFEKSMQETGGWRYGSDNVFAARVQRCIDHYTRMAANAVGDAHEFKDSVVAWLRGMAISAQSVSWASTHAEKDARLRGLIEVIETAISNINEKRVNDRLSSWRGVVDSWGKSDFPTREMRRRILDQQEEIERLKKSIGKPESTIEAVSHGYGD